MSYCRWSCDNFKSDVYTYAHCDGTWTTHVASSRHASIDECPKTDFAGLLDNTVTSEEFNEQCSRQSEFLGKAEMVPIDLPHDGETIKDDGPGECLATLLRLREVGYHVPDHALDELGEEATHADKPATPKPKAAERKTE